MTDQPGADDRPTMDNAPEGTPAFESLPQYWQDYYGKLRRENASHRTKANEWQNKARDLEAKYTEAGQLLETANKRLEGVGQLEDQHEKDMAEVEAAKAEAGKVRAAASAGLPVDFADRLKGANAEEWQADAKALAEHFGSKGAGGQSGQAYRDYSQGKSTNQVPLNSDVLTEKFREIFS